MQARTQRAARLCELAAELPQEERALVLSHYAGGRSSAEIAAIAGCSRSLIERKLRRLTARMARREYVFLAPRLHQLDEVQRAVARACFIEGRSIRAAAISLKMSAHALRERRAVLMGLVRGVGMTREVEVVEKAPMVLSLAMKSRGMREGGGSS